MNKAEHGLRKAETHIRGFDEVLHGGIPEGAMTLLSGGPGTGKTMIAMEFILRGAVSGNPGIFLTFEETKDSLDRYASMFGWDIYQLEESQKLRVINAAIDPDSVLSGDFDLRGLMAIVKQHAKTIGAQRIVIDAPDVFLRLLNDIQKERSELLIIYEWMRTLKLTSLMTVKRSYDQAPIYDFLDYMADCVIHLDQRVAEQVATRRLRVIKYRGSSCGRNEYPFGFTKSGICIIPVTQANLEHKELGSVISSGISSLDSIISGGYRKNSCTLFTGGSGTGKTTFSCSFILSAVKQKERALYIDFEESWDSLTSCMISPGIDLKPALDSGYLRFISSMPESQGVEEHLIQAFQEIEAFQPKHLVVDAISACRRMGSRHAAFDYLIRLIDHCKKHDITTVLTNLTSSLDPKDDLTSIDLSSMIDTVIVLKYVEHPKEYKRELSILKSRGRNHSNKIHEFYITDHGIEIAVGERDDGNK